MNSLKPSKGHTKIKNLEYQYLLFSLLLEKIKLKGEKLLLQLQKDNIW